MSLILNKALAANALGAAQIAYIHEQRRVADVMNANLAQSIGLQANALPNLDPRAWLDLDQATVQLLAQEPDVIFRDLNALSTPIPIGKIIAAYRRLGAMDAGDSSLTGQTPSLLGSVGHDYDGVPIPIHKKAFGIMWRELEGLRTIGYDTVAEHQQAATREVIRLQTVNMTYGNPNLNYQGVTSTGLFNSPNTLAVELAVDFTNPAITFAEADAGFNVFVQSIRGGTNRVTADGVVYISPEIEANLARRSGAQTIDRTWLAVLRETPGVSDIRVSRELTGNQMAFVVLNRQFVELKTAAPINTIQVPRTLPFQDYHWNTWCASGLLVKADQDGRTGVAFGS